MTKAYLAALVHQVHLMFPPAADLDISLVEARLLETAQYNGFQLTALPLITSTGMVEYHTFIDPIGGSWDDAITLQDPSWVPITPTDADNINGKWTFNNPLLGVFITGSRYDLNRACANLARHMALSVAGNIDFTADGLTVRNSSVITNYQSLASQFDALTRVYAVTMQNG